MYYICIRVENIQSSYTHIFKAAKCFIYFIVANWVFLLFGER